MKQTSQRIALCGMMVGLATAAMLLGGVIPVMTFCSPAIAGLALLPVLAEYGRKWAMAAYAAIAALSLMLSPDKESALLFAFLGYYPVAKTYLDRIRSKPLRVLAKLGLFNAAAGLMLASIAWVFNMKEVMAEYAGMSAAMLAVFALVANVTLLLYDRMLGIAMLLYHRRLRKNVFRK